MTLKMEFPFIFFKTEEKKNELQYRKIPDRKMQDEFLKFGTEDKNLINIPGLNVKSVLDMADVIVQGIC
ncbi:hypothetical protein SAMN02910357_02012 [Succinivibrio dextrinosolvens]|uniref:hypothetical protein n=1 Tax=Succinivibrio dextrinosolvens TaxID=83771 RepID=UPI0008EED180|nr:hypothetical protein [Succinivibrio dextrinosolvens]SFS81901.1 hypothetical protein SAMN02910357_02012 [Succinivibrio dextrinosolvens]